MPSRSAANTTPRYDSYELASVASVARDERRGVGDRGRADQQTAVGLAEGPKHGESR